MFVLFAFPLLAQQTAATGEFSIAGAVVNSVTGERIKQAFVQLWSAAARGVPKTAFADAAGTFRFSGLPAGSYTITATKPHFAPSSPQVSLTLSASREDVSLPLEPRAVIKGRVLDTYGDPLPGILVHALQPRMENGHRRLAMYRWGRSNDRGDYRIGDLPPAVTTSRPWAGARPP
ncbi:MAG: carboxypeptidase-like regulatory domain-containing protein [Bryobacteraceae bacterium]